MICVDISTNQGRDTVGSLVYFEAGRPKKAEYRKFRIKTVTQQDDFAATHEVILRYFRRRLDEAQGLLSEPHAAHTSSQPMSLVEQRRARRGDV